MISFRAVGVAALTLKCLSCLWTCPHSKVEESFNLQATHDLFYYGLSLSVGEGEHLPPYDHLQYPGVVPRTFTGAILLSTVLRVLRFLLYPMFDLSTRPLLVQFLSRLLLLALTVHAHSRLASSLQRDVGGYFLIITASQFHIPFYGSRMLPNVFALLLVTHAYADWFRAKLRRALSLLVIATVVFRCDVLLLLLCIGLSICCWTRKDMIRKGLHVGVLSSLISLTLVIPLDSILWKTPYMWAEGHVLFFNTVQNKSGQWGISPWHWYFTVALPKVLLGTMLFIPISFCNLSEMKRTKRCRPSVFMSRWLDTQMMPYAVPVLGFVVLYSILPHKEIRFIFPAIPMLNAIAAHGMVKLQNMAFPSMAVTKEKKLRITTRRKERLFVLSLWIGGLGAICVTLLASVLFLMVSMHNYPGGDALLLLQRHLNEHPSNKDVHLYIDVAAAMSGISLFGQRAASSSSSSRAFRITKSGYEPENSNLHPNDRHEEEFTHILTEHESLIWNTNFHVIGITKGFPTIHMAKFTIDTKEAIYLLERNDYHSNTTIC